MPRNNSGAKRYRPIIGGARSAGIGYSPYGTGCPAIDQAIEGLYRDKNEESFWTLMSALNYAMQLETRVLVPLNETPSGHISPAAWVKRPIPAEKGADLPPWLVHAGNGTSWLPLFTSAGSAASDRGSAFRPVTELTLQAALEKALATEGIEGVVIDPWLRSASLDKSLLRGLLRAGHEEDDVEKAMDAARAAASEGDWAAVAEQCTRAAEAGSPDGLTMLGECFYYGRGARRSRTEARRLWKLAADHGSVRALILLGDDQLGDDKPLGRSLMYYRKAQALAARQPDISYTPEVRLRMAQAEMSFLTSRRQQAIAMTAEAIQGFTIRQKSGDPDAADWLREARELLSQLEQLSPPPSAYKESLQMD